MKVKYLLPLPLILTALSTTYGSHICYIAGKKHHCNDYYLAGKTTFKNGVKLPLYSLYYVSQPDSISYQPKTPLKRSDLYSNFAMPKNMANKFVMFRDDTGLELIPKDFMPLGRMVLKGMMEISYIEKDGKGEIDINSSYSPLDQICSEAAWFPTPENVRECNKYGNIKDFNDYEKPKHIDYYNRNKKVAIYTHNKIRPLYIKPYPPSQFKEVTIILGGVILGGPKEIDIILPKKDKAIMNTLIKYYTHR